MGVMLNPDSETHSGGERFGVLLYLLEIRETERRTLPMTSPKSETETWK